MKGPRSKKVQNFVTAKQQALAVSNWCETEFYGVLGRRVRDGGLPTNLAERSAHRYEQHRDGRLFTFYALNQQSVNEAALLTRRFKLGIKSADALHLGLVKLRGLILVTSDVALASVAKDLELETHLIE